MPRARPPPKGPAAYICKGCKKFFKRQQDYTRHRKQTQKAQCKMSKARRLSSGDKGRRPFASSLESASSGTPMDVDQDAALDEPQMVDEPQETPTNRRARVEDAVDEGDEPTRTFTKPYPSDRKAGFILRHGSPPAQFEFGHLHGDGTNDYFPFADRSEWEIAQWVKNEAISDAAFDRFCKIPSRQPNTTIKNARHLNQTIDQLPGYGSWQYTLVTVDDSAQPHEVFYRNPIDCLRALWADPAFAEHMSYAPEKRYTDATENERLFTEMNTGDFWWEIQAKLPLGATAVPIIISTDKTELSMFTGDATAYPIYMTIGNIDSSIRRQPSRYAQILIGYLPTTTIEKGDLSDLALRNARARLFHTAVRTILEPLRDAAAIGVHLKSSNGDVRDCYPVLAVYAADYPEQCLVACTRYGSRCPKCKAGKDDFSSGKAAEARDPGVTFSTIHEADELNSMSAIDDFLRPYGLNYVPEPFWADWPHADIHQAIAPDILHQLYQGMVKHLTAWARHIVGDDELDRRFKRASLAHGLRHFSNGISSLQRVSGEEHKAIAKQLLACLAGIPEKDAVRAARALLDFTYLAQYSCHSDETLTLMDDALAEFHKYQDVFLTTGAAESLDLPKLHSLVHYTSSIRLFGVTGGYNTEQTERLHIDYAKRAYDASNHREDDILPFMCTWLERREKMFRFATYLADRQGETFSSLKRRPKERERPAVAFADAPNDPHRSVLQITADHGADLFAEQLVAFVKNHVKTEWKKKHGGAVPSYQIPAVNCLGFDVWHRVKFHTPDTQTLDAPDTLDVANAAPARRRKAKRTKALPARFDAVMVETNGDGVAGEGGMEGIRIAQLRVLFELPEHMQVSIFDRLHIPRPGKLAYIEWFSKLGASVDDVTGMYRVRRSFKSGTENRVRQASVIEAVDLRRSCHLIARLSGHRPSIPLHLSVHNLLDRWTDFWINNFVDKPAYRSVY